MSILLFYYALFFAITCVVAAPTGTATAIPGGSLENIEDFLVETTFHRVTKYHGTKPRWSDPEDRKLDDVIKFKKNGGILRVAYTRPIRVRQNRIDPLHLQQWCLDQNGVEQGKKYFENDNNYIPVNRLRLGGPIPLAGSWVDSKIFSLVSLFYDKFGNCLITLYRMGPRPSITLRY